MPERAEELLQGSDITQVELAQICYKEHGGKYKDFKGKVESREKTKMHYALKGRNKVDETTINVIARKLNVDPFYLIGKTNLYTPYPSGGFKEIQPLLLRSRYALELVRAILIEYGDPHADIVEDDKKKHYRIKAYGRKWSAEEADGLIDAVCKAVRDYALTLPDVRADDMGRAILPPPKEKSSSREEILQAKKDMEQYNWNKKMNELLNG